ncbi:MAG: dihydroorotate dehydrogenase-like protein [Pseudomonadota bacterium]
MADLSCAYLGLTLANPLVPSSSPLTAGVDGARRLEDAGAAALVMPSLFEEDILAEDARLDRFIEGQQLGHAEADSYRPLPATYRSREETYLESLAAMKQALAIPVIASLNGVTSGGWLEHAKALEEAGADAIELNLYYLAADEGDTAQAVEDRYCAVAALLRQQVELPLAVKLGSQVTAPLHLVRRLEAAGVRGVCLFNRFYQPDIDLDTLEVVPRLELSHADEALLRIRWAAMLFGRCACDVAVTGGFHGAAEAIKALLAGASVVHLCSALLRDGPSHIARVLQEMSAWLEDKEYDSIEQLRGSLSLQNAPEPARYGRANYRAILDNFSPPSGVQH